MCPASHSVKSYPRAVCVCVVLLALLLLWGCEKRTTIILPSGTTSPISSTAYTTEPTEMPTESPTEPAIAETTNPAVNNPPPVKTATPAETTAPTTASNTVPSTAPNTVPTTVPATEPEVISSCYDISNHTIGSLEYTLIEEINRYRTEAGLSSLSLDTKLCALSAVRARECGSSWSHVRPDGRSYTTVFSDYGCPVPQSHAENLLTYSGSYAASDLVGVWMNSDPHRENILRPDFTQAGLGVYHSDSASFVVCLFTE